jgi:hypothetical protein
VNVAKTVVTGAAGIALVAAGTAAGAAIHYSPRGRSGVIHGCYQKPAIGNGSHSFMLQNVRTPCPSGWSAISWNQKGPAGTPGPSGPSGIISMAQYQEVDPPIVTGSDWQFLGSPTKEDFIDSHTAATVIYSDGGVTFLSENGNSGDIGICYEPVGGSTLINVGVPDIATPTAVLSGITAGAYYIGPCAKNQSLVTNNTDATTIIMAETR